jgi:hypothetical protein
MALRGMSERRNIVGILSRSGCLVVISISRNGFESAVCLKCRVVIDLDLWKSCLVQFGSV